MTQDATPTPSPAPPSTAPFWRKRRWVLPVFFVSLVLVFCLGLKARSLVQALVPDWFEVKKSEKSVLSVLRSEEMMFLVTDRVVTRIDVELNESARWAGGRQGVLLATVRLYYGIDLEKLDASAVTETKDRILIRVPTPRLLDYSMDQDSIRFFDRRTGIWALVDWYNNRDVEKEMLASVKHRAMEFADRNGIAPRNDKVLARLNRFGDRLSADMGKKIEFQYVDK